MCCDGELATKLCFDETGLPWVFPSPNMPTLDTATVYPGMCLLEATNLFRGAAPPALLNSLELLARARALCRFLEEQELPGSVFAKRILLRPFTNTALANR